MAFLDNSSSILLDTALTDEGRKRLANGSFKISKFALGDDEVDYTLFDSTETTALQDIDILNSPILEAFTNNASSMNSKLISIARNDLLFLPKLQINDLNPTNKLNATTETYFVAVDSDTEFRFIAIQGTIFGYSPQSLGKKGAIRVDQGLDTTSISPLRGMPSDLLERQYVVELDNRFGKIVGVDGTKKDFSYVDDDNIASYFVSLGTDPSFVYDIQPADQANPTDKDAKGDLMIFEGPRGTSLQFKIEVSDELIQSTYYFDRFGRSATYTPNVVTEIDAVVRIMGATTGYRIDVPVKYIKYVSAV